MLQMHEAERAKFLDSLEVVKYATVLQPKLQSIIGQQKFSFRINFVALCTYKYSL